MINLSLRSKIIVTICSIVLMCAIAMSSVYVSKSEQLVKDIATKEIETETQLLASRLAISIEASEEELAGLSHIFAVEEIVEAVSAITRAGDDPVAPANAKAQLESIFWALLSEEPAYAQIRLLTAAQNGQELVRVNRTAEGIEIVPNAELQQKGDEPYIQEALAYVDPQIDWTNGADKHAHQIYLSQITLNREYGLVTEPKSANLRMISPVYAADGQLFGFLIINTDWGTFLQEAFKDVRVAHSVFVFNENMDYFEYVPELERLGFEFHETYSAPPPAFLMDAATSTESILTSGEDDLTVHSHFNINNDPSRYFSVLVRVDQSALLAGVRDLGSFSVVMSLALVALAFICSLLFADWLTSPLQSLTDAVVDAKRRHAGLKIAHTRNDEIGTLAREFSELSQSLAESEIKTGSILKGIGEGIIAITDRGMIFDTNPALNEVFGYEKDELIGQSIAVLMPAPARERSASFFGQPPEAGRPNINWFKQEAVGQKKSGELFDAELTITEVTLKNESVYIGIVRDISERKAIEKAKSEFLATVSHELKTPLTSIMGALQILKMAPQADARNAKLLDAADRNSHRLLRLVEDILDFESYNKGELRLQKVVFDVNQLVQQSCEEMQMEAENAGIDIRLERSGQPLWVDGDKKRLFQAVTNLLTNAMKFSKRGGAVAVTCAPGEDAQTVCIAVADNGIGIPESELENIFKSFTRVDSPTRGPPKARVWASRSRAQSLSSTVARSMSRRALA